MTEHPVQAEFVGGPWDGNRRTVMAGGYGYRIPLETPIFDPPTFDELLTGERSPTIRIMMHIYTRRDRLTRAGYVAFEYEGLERPRA